MRNITATDRMYIRNHSAFLGAALLIKIELIAALNFLVICITEEQNRY